MLLMNSWPENPEGGGAGSDDTIWFLSSTNKIGWDFALGVNYERLKLRPLQLQVFLVLTQF